MFFGRKDGQNWNNGHFLHMTICTQTEIHRPSLRTFWVVAICRLKFTFCNQRSHNVCLTKNWTNVHIPIWPSIHTLSSSTKQYILSYCRIHLFLDEQTERRQNWNMRITLMAGNPHTKFHQPYLHPVWVIAGSGLLAFSVLLFVLP